MKSKSSPVLLQKFPVTLIALTLIILSGVVGIAYLVSNRFGDLRPALLPAQQTFAEFIQQNTELGKPHIPVPEGTTTEQLGNSQITLPEGFGIRVVTDQLTSPRDLLVTPDNTLLVSDNERGQILAVIDSNDNGQRDSVRTLLDGLHISHGLAFYKNAVFVAEENKVTRFAWDSEQLALTDPQIILQLPTGGRHTSRTLAIMEDGTLYVSLGSRCDTCFEDHEWIGAVIVTNIQGENPRVFATGLRNAVFLQLHPETGALWATEMGRDFLGDDLPPDEINILTAGGNYGWPVCYGNKIYDTVFGQRSPEFCETTMAPVYEIQAHSAPLGLTFIQSAQFPDEWQNDLLVAYHGSWNRSVPVGYKIVRLEIDDTQQSVVAEHDFLTGFLQGRTALGRPVDVEFDRDGHLFISDDKTGAIYEISRN